MSVTSKLKKGVDIPVWEWLRPLPTTTTGPSTFATGGKPYGRYIYYFPTTTNAPFRYDTWTEGFNQITSPPQSQTTVACSRYNDLQGYMFRAISAGSGSNTVQCAVPKGNKCVGNKIKIVSGTGAGQVRTITAVSDPTVHDTMIVTTGSTGQIIDSNKSYSQNLYRDYGIRIIGNTNTYTRKVLYNTNNTLVFAANSFTPFGVPWAYSILPYTTSTTAGSQTIAQIESYEITVDSNWDTAPDNTSVFVIQSGIIWNVNASSASRFALQYYDVLNDSWFQATSVGGGAILDAGIGTDIAIETLNESAVGVLKSGTASSSSGRVVSVSGSSFDYSIYTNYIIRITGGTGFGQDRLIESGGSSSITAARAWDIQPDNTSTFDIVADNDKIYMHGTARAAMLEYDCVNDVWSDSRILEAGSPCNLCLTWKGYKNPVGITTITRSGTTATATTLHPHGLKVGDIITIYGATDSLYNAVNVAIDTVTSSTVFTYTMAGTPAVGSATASFTNSSTLLVDPTKNWAVNELVGKAVAFTASGYTATGGFQQTYYYRVIVSNTATTITFAAAVAAAPTGNSIYYINDIRNHGGIFTSQVASGSTTTVINTVNSLGANNIYAGRRCIIKDNASWVEASISSHTGTAITLSAAIGFTPSANAVITILGAYITGAGCSLEYLYNTSTKQKGRYMYGVRGGATNYMYLYDITTNTWEILNQMPNAETLSTGSMTAYDGDDRVYIHRDQTGRILYYDFTDNNLYSFSQIPYGMATAQIGNRMSIIKTEDGLKFLYLPRHNSQEFWRTLLWV